MDYQSYLARIVKDATGMNIDEARQTPLCELRNRLPLRDREYGGLYYADRHIHSTTREINASLDKALERAR